MLFSGNKILKWLLTVIRLKTNCSLHASSWVIRVALVYVHVKLSQCSVSVKTRGKKLFNERVCTLPSFSAPVSLALVCSRAEKSRKAVVVITLSEIEQHASLPFFR